MIAIVDEAIPYIKGVLEPYVDVLYANGDGFAKALEGLREDAALLVRTRTECGRELLEGSNVRFIASATIGLDHIDRHYCYTHNICVANAPGCNSMAVVQYFFTSLSAVGSLPELKEERKGMVIGVVGAGMVGEKVARLASKLGFKVMRNDPPKQLEQEKAIAEGRLEAGNAIEYFSLEDVLQNSDILTLHTPLDNTTRGLAGKSFFSMLKKGSHLVNASRGAVVDDEALLSSSGLGMFICDVWNNEPEISKKVLERAILATPHIAGYSVEGKQNATDAVVRALAEFAGIDELRSFSCRKSDDRHHLNIEGDINTQLQEFFPIGELDAALRKHPEEFEKLRKNYIYRHEFDY